MLTFFSQLLLGYNTRGKNGNIRNAKLEGGGGGGK